MGRHGGLAAMLINSGLAAAGSDLSFHVERDGSTADRDVRGNQFRPAPWPPAGARS
jgi:hypothetical protein